MMNLQLFRNNSPSSERAAYIMVYLMWGISCFGELLTAAGFRLVEIDMVIEHSTTWFIIILMSIFSIKYSKKYIYGKDIFCWLLYGLLFEMNYMVYLQNQTILETYMVKSVFLTFPFLFMGELIDIHSMKKVFSRISLITIVWYVFYSMYYLQNKMGSFSDNGMRENMHFAYLVLPHVLMCVWSSFTEKKDYLSYLGATLGVVLLLSYGNRGSIIDLLFFVVVYILFFVNYKRRWLIWFLTIIIGFILYYYVVEIILFLQVTFEELGMSTRIFDTLSENSFFTGNSVDERDAFKDVLWNAVRNAPLFGYGICGSWQFIQSYPHDLVLDLFISFGPFAGSLLMISLAALSIRAYRSCVTDTERQFLLLLFIVGVFKLFISYTFIDNVETFMYIGYCFYLIRNKRKSVA